jgi:hypothetical protein
MSAGTVDHEEASLSRRGDLPMEPSSAQVDLTEPRRVLREDEQPAGCTAEVDRADRTEVKRDALA